MAHKPTLDELLLLALTQSQARETALSLLVARACRAGFHFVESRRGNTAALVFLDDEGHSTIYQCSDNENARIERAAALWKLYRGGPFFASLVESLRADESYAGAQRVAA